MRTPNYLNDTTDFPAANGPAAPTASSVGILACGLRRHPCRPFQPPTKTLGEPATRDGCATRAAFLGLLCFLCFLLFPSAVPAQSSATSISFQGALAGAGGQPLPNGSYTLGFQFWDHPTGTAASNRVGSAVTVPGVAVSGGVASTAIPVQPDWFNGQTRYLGITVQGVNAGQELLPRVLVTAVPYAISAGKLGNSVVIAANGDVGIGSANLKLEGGGASALFDIVKTTGDGNPPVVRVYKDVPQEDSNVTFTILRQGQVGIGTSMPDNAALDVRGGRTKVERLTIDSHMDNQALEISGPGESPLVDITKTSGRDNSPILRVFKDNPRIDAQLVFTILRDGRIGVGTPAPQTTLEVNGTTRTTVLQITSARAAKEGFSPVDAAAVLAKVAALPIATWAYTNSHGVRHLGPVAEDFHAAFALGDSAQHIATVDADGVALAAIQGLHQLVQEKDAKIHGLEKRLEALERKLESRIAAQERP